MNRKELENIIKKYRGMSSKAYPHNEEKAAYYERIANHLEDNIDDYIDSEYFTTEDDVINDIKELFSELDGFYDDEDCENMNI